MMNVDEKSMKNIKMKKIVKKRFSKKKKNFDIIMFEIVDVKNSNAEIFMKYHINDTTTISNNFIKFFFEFKSFLNKESTTQTQEKEQKKKEFEKKIENKSFEKMKEKKTNK